MGTRWLWIVSALLVAGCGEDSTSARDVHSPAAPRGFYSVTGDGEVYLEWLENTEGDVAGYRIYESPCSSGPTCPYDRVGVTQNTSFVVTGLVNGETRYFAVAAYDHAGNESELSYADVFDTPRPEGFGVQLQSYQSQPQSAGWDFSAQALRAWDDTRTDMFYGANGSVLQMFVPDTQTDIQDAGVASSLDAVDFAPITGWSPSGTVELIEGHCYVVWTRDDHYAKFRVTDIVTGTQGDPVVFLDWAYQVDPGNRELRARRLKDGQRGATRPITWIR